MFKTTLAAAALAAASFGASAATNFVVDGSFEDTVVNANTYATVSSTDGWSTAANGLEIRNALAGTAEDLNNFAELDTSANSSISQLLNVGAGSYKLTFFVQDRADTTADTNGIDYTVNGVTKSIVGGTTANWTEVTEFFTTAGPTTLSFAATGTSDGYGSSLDNISVSAVPEPGTLALMASGLALLGLSRRRQSR